MTVIQFRRYEVSPEHLDEFLAWWPEARAAREAAGFRVLFAYGIRDSHEFVWAIEHDGDLAAFERAVERFRASPERAQAFEVDPRSWLDAMHERFVDEVLHPFHR